MDTIVLKQIGLSEGEIKVYFALLELESSTVGRIIEKSGVPDSKIYSILEKLKEKGLTSFVIKNNVKHFQASDPKNLVKLLSEKEKAIRMQKEELEEKIIPEIEKKRKLTEDKQEAVVYESMEGLMAAMNYMLDVTGSSGEYKAFVISNVLAEKKVKKFFDDFHKIRLKKGVRVKRISNIQYKDVLEKNYSYKNMESRFTDQKIPVGIFVFKNHVMTIVFEKPTAFVIKSKITYEHYDAFFDDLWKTSKP